MLSESCLPQGIKSHSSGLHTGALRVSLFASNPVKYFAVSRPLHLQRRAGRQRVQSACGDGSFANVILTAAAGFAIGKTWVFLVGKMLPPVHSAQQNESAESSEAFGLT